MLIDTHAHLCDPAFDADREEVISALPGLGVERVIEIACEPAGFAAAAALSDRRPAVYLSFGIHPEYALTYTQDDLAAVEEYLSRPKAVALGEIGLDYHYQPVDRAAQTELFEVQLRMAKRLGLPVSLHVRDAYGDCMEILRRNREGLKGVMHCFSGSAEIARQCVDLGLYIAFGGAVTFKNNRRGVEAAAAVPLDRLLIETDCPYMAPVPHRGERCDPSMTRLTCMRLAEIKGVSYDEMEGAAYGNALRLFFSGKS